MYNSKVVNIIKVKVLVKGWVNEPRQGPDMLVLNLLRLARFLCYCDCPRNLIHPDKGPEKTGDLTGKRRVKDTKEPDSLRLR